MIAATRRMAIQDFLLIAFSVVVIVLSFLPTGDARQTLVVRHQNGLLQRYSFETDDPRLAKLRHDLANWSRRVPDASLALEKWRGEIAEYYASRTEREAEPVDDVRPVSFSIGQPATAGNGAAKLPNAQHAYWIAVGEKSRLAVAESESRRAQQRMLIGPPPVTFGNVTRGSHSPNVFVLATLMGLFVASGFALWTYIFPAIRLAADVPAPQLQAPKPADASRFHELRLTIPAQWVRLHQPWSVVTRQVAFATVVVVGFACVILL